MCHRLKSIINVQTWYHHQESVGVDTPDESSEYKAVPRLVCLVDQGVDCVCDEEWNRNNVEIFESNGIVFLGLLFCLREIGLVFKNNTVRDEGSRAISDPDVDHRGNFPEFDEDTDPRREENHPT